MDKRPYKPRMSAEEKEKNIQIAQSLRDKGMSYEKIKKQTGIPKATLRHWLDSEHRKRHNENLKRRYSCSEYKQKTREYGIEQRKSDDYKERRKAYMKKLRVVKGNALREYFRNYYQRKKAEDPLFNERINAAAKGYRARKPIEYRKTKREYMRKMYATDIIFRISASIRKSVYQRIKKGKGKRPGSAVAYLGCTLVELKTHLEKQFTNGMSWDNYGKWHIDHRIPLASFDLTDKEQFIQAVHFSNLQPLWRIDNIRKGKKIFPEFSNV